MRSKSTAMVAIVASLLLATTAMAADPIQDQLRVMEQRMAEMEDRLHATSSKLEVAEDKLEKRDTQLIENGLLAADDEDGGFRSGVGKFFNEVDVSGVAAASFNYRLIESDVDTDGGSGLAGGNDIFTHPNSNTFQLDQFWLTLDKAPTEESRGGFHVELVTGTSALAQGGNNDDEPYLYTGYVSYLAPIGNGLQFDFGKLATPLGAEVIQTDGNFFVTQGRVFGLQPVTHTGLSVSTAITDELSFIIGVVNEVYSDTAVSLDNDKAGYAQFSYSGDSFGLNVGGIIGDDETFCVGSDCLTSVFDVVLTVDPAENVSLWANFDWVHSSGEDFVGHGDAFGISVAGRVGITDTFGIASRFEYVMKEDTLVGAADDEEVISLTGTLDKELAQGLVGKFEVRWDHSLDDSVLAFAGNEEDQLVALAQMLFSF